MQWKKNSATILATLAFISLAGLVMLQFFWLQKVYQQESRAFDEAHRTLLGVIDDEYEDTIETTFNLKTILNNEDETETQRFLKAFTNLIEGTIEDSPLIFDYQYAISTIDSDQLQYFSHPSNKQNILTGIRKKMGSGLDVDFKTNIQGGIHHFYLYLYFPEKLKILFPNIFWAIASSLFFMLVLISTFVYTLRSMMRQKKLSDMRRDLINNLTHEFKTPIATISLASRTLKRMEPIKVTQKAYNFVDLIDQETIRLENHVDKVLQMSLMDSGHLELDLATVNAHEKIRAVCKSLQLMINEKGGFFNLNLDAEVADIEVDAMHFFNIIYNLLDNAIKYSSEKADVRVRTWNRKKELRIAIEDKGIGMNKEEQALIFDQFYRPKNDDVHDTKGFGLGLSYVKQMMEAHGASIQLQSKKGKGTSFELSFSIIR